VTDDTTTARRALLDLLIDGIENSTLPDADRGLIRPLVDAEKRTAAQLDTRTANTEPQQPADALYEVVTMLQAIGTGTWADAIDVVQARAMAHDRNGGRALALAGRTVSSEAAWQAALDRANAETDRRERQYTAEYIRADRAEAELTAARTANAEAVQLIEMQKKLIGTERRLVMTAISHREDQGVREQACDHCGRDHMAELDEAVQAADKEYAATFPAASERLTRPGRLPEAPVVCSPLVNPDCPGHTGTDRCERAPSHTTPAPAAAALLEETHTP
jgi:hypothetical protein